MRKSIIPKRELLFGITFLVISITSILVWQLNRKDGEYKPGINGTNDRAVNTARTLLEEQKKRKVDLSSMPCISNALMKDWAADLVHNPKVPEDSLPENQCEAIREKTATHYVELDLDGNVMKIK